MHRLSHYTTPTAPLYNIIIMFDTVLKQKKNLNTKDNEFNIAAISLLWHAPPGICRGQFNVADIRTSTVENVKIALSEQIALLLHPRVDIQFGCYVT